MYKAYIHITKNHNNANGNIYSIWFHKLGINIADRLNNTFIVIANVKGILIKVTSLFVSFILWNSSVFLNLI